MGDDWEDKFDWVSCPCLYFPRTPEYINNITKQQLLLDKK
jgi:hypothetical protein